MDVNYELHTLGWKAFQNLCITIASEVWGQTVQSFFDSYDGGRDGAFQGIWEPKKGEPFKGTFTVQCKFTAKPDARIQITDLKDELSKATRLAERGLASNYFLFTNARLTGVSEEKICKAFQAIPGIERFKAYGVDRISRMICESSRLRMLVPRIYGLGDLSQILDERAHDQAKEILSALGDELRKFVITDAYLRSAKALVEHGFVLLLGEPACGKSTIAAALALGALDEWGCLTFKIYNAEDFVAHSNPHEPKQFFWVDDAFGATQFDWSSAMAWNRVFAHMHAAIRRGARVLFTSRDYIYRSARQHLKESALPILRESQVVIRVEQLTKEEREQILYNHIRLGSQPTPFRGRIKPFLPEIAEHRRFSPEIARRLGNPLFTGKLSLTKLCLQEFVEHPVELLCEIIRTVDPESRSALALVFMRGGQLLSPVKMSNEEENAVSLIGGSHAGVRNALNALNGSLVLQSVEAGSYVWRFKHPTIRDAFAAVISEDKELMDIYLSGVPIDKLLSEISCGDVGIEGVKVLVPVDRYGLIIARLKSIDTTRWEGCDRLNRFLSYRCDKQFLSCYIAHYPDFISGLHVGSYFYADSDISTLVRLHDFGLLPEAKRLAVVTDIRELVVYTPDDGFLSERLSRLITQSELDAIWEDIRQRLLPNLEGIISRWRSNYSANDDQDPENYFYELGSCLRTLRDELAEDEDATYCIETALEKIEATVLDLQSEPENADSDDFRGDSSERAKGNHARSIFDDVDQ